MALSHAYEKLLASLIAHKKDIERAEQENQLKAEKIKKEIDQWNSIRQPNLDFLQNKPKSTKS